MPYCCVAGSCSNVEGKDVTLHDFPHNRPDVLTKWVKFVRVKRKDFPKATRHSHLCSDHFVRDDYDNIVEFEMGFSSKRRLKPDAVPSLHKNPPARPFPPTTLALSTTSSASDSAAAVTRTQSKKRSKRRNPRQHFVGGAPSQKLPDPMPSPCSPDTGQSTSTTPKPSCPRPPDRSTFSNDEPLKKRLRKTLVASENANKGLCEAEDVHNSNNAPSDAQQTKDAEGLGILALAVENRRQEEALDGLSGKGRSLQEARQVGWKEPGREAYWKPREQNHAYLLHFEVGVPSPVPNLNLGYSDNSQQQARTPTKGSTALSPPEPSSSEPGVPDLPLPDHFPEVGYTASASSSWPAVGMLIKSEPESPDLPKLDELPEVGCAVAAANRWPAEVMSIKSELEEPGLSPSDELLPEVGTAELLSIKSEPEEPSVPSPEEFLPEVSSTVIAANRWPTEGVSIKSEPEEPGLPSPDELCPEVSSASVAANGWPAELVSMKSEPESPGLPPPDELPEIRSTAAAARRWPAEAASMESQPDSYQSCAANCAGGTSRTPCSGCHEKDELIRILQAHVSSLQEELAATTCQTCTNNRFLKRQQAWQQFAFKDPCPKSVLRSSNTFLP